MDFKVQATALPQSRSGLACFGSSPSRFTILADRGKRHPPPGALGGKAGAPTACTLYRGRSATGSKKRISLPIKCSVELSHGDVFEISTAGGGGYGEPRERSQESTRRDVSNGLLSKSYVRKNYRT